VGEGYNRVYNTEADSSRVVSYRHIGLWQHIRTPTYPGVVWWEVFVVLSLSQRHMIARWPCWIEVKLLGRVRSPAWSGKARVIKQRQAGRSLWA
jgi:hypothetical protein